MKKTRHAENNMYEAQYLKNKIFYFLFSFKIWIFGFTFRKHADIGVWKVKSKIYILNEINKHILDLRVYVGLLVNVILFKTILSQRHFQTYAWSFAIKKVVV